MNAKAVQNHVFVLEEGGERCQVQLLDKMTSCPTNDSDLWTEFEDTC